MASTAVKTPNAANASLLDAITTEAQKKPLSWALLLFPWFEALDVFGPIEALNILYKRSGPPSSTGNANQSSLKIIGNYDTLDPISTGPSPDHAAQGFNALFEQKVVPTHCIRDFYDGKLGGVDALIVPGGFGADVSVASDVTRHVRFIRDVFPKLEVLVTVCTGSALAARAGVLDGLTATTNKLSFARVAPLGPKTYWKASARWCVSGKVWTSSGVSAGIDCMLAFIADYYGRETALNIAKIMEYEWNSDAEHDAFTGELEDVKPVA